MSYYFRLGQVPHKRHTQFRKPDGSLYHEELMGIHGFTGNKSLLYHLHPPTAVERIDRGCQVEIPFADEGPVRHRLLSTADIPVVVGGIIPDADVPLLEEAGVAAVLTPGASEAEVVAALEAALAPA